MSDPTPADSSGFTAMHDALDDFSQAEARLRSLNEIVHRGNHAPAVRKDGKAALVPSHMTKFKLAQTHNPNPLNPHPPKKVGLSVYIKQQKPNLLMPLRAAVTRSAESGEDAAFQFHSTDAVGTQRLVSSADGFNPPLFAADASAAPEAAAAQPSSAKPSYRKRYLQMLRCMESEARLRKEEEEQRVVQEERRRAKLREKVIGSEDVGSKFLCATADALKAAEEAKLARQQQESKAQVDPDVAKEEERQRQREANKQIAEKTKLLLQAIETKKKAEAEREARLRRKAEAIKKKVREVVLELCARAPGADNSDGGSSSGDEDTPKKAVRWARARHAVKYCNTLQVRVRKPAQFASYEEAQKYFWDSGKHAHGCRVFMSTYPLIKEELVKRGWVENPDFEDSVFDAKFVLKTSDIEYATPPFLQCIIVTICSGTRRCAESKLSTISPRPAPSPPKSASCARSSPSSGSRTWRSTLSSRAATISMISTSWRIGSRTSSALPARASCRSL
jgi:hypothetical protein